MNDYVTVAIRLIYYMPVTPSCDIVQMDKETWDKFRFGDKYERMEIALKLVGQEDMDGKVREVAWIPLGGQDKLLLAPNAFVLDSELDDD